MNMLILKLWDMLSSELQRRQLCESGIAAFAPSASARLQSVCVFSAHVVSRERDVALQRRRLYVCTYMELSIGPVGAMNVRAWGDMLVLEDCLPPCILICLPTFISAGSSLHVPDSFN